MAFIEKKDPTILKAKLTSEGRNLLSQGKLNFKYFEVGDSEIDYKYANIIGIDNYKPSILMPFDKNPDILSIVYSGSTTGESYVQISNNLSKSYIITNTATELGFFSNSGDTILTGSTIVKQPNIQISIDEVIGGRSLSLYKSPTYVAASPEPAVNDLLMVKWINKRGTNTNASFDIDSDNPSPYLFYKITGITSGTLAANNLIVTVDREIPSFSGNTGGSAGKLVGGVLYYNEDIYAIDPLSPSEYVSQSILDFIDNCQCDIVEYPIWNLSIIHTQEIAGVKTTDLEYTNFSSSGLTGFVTYIQEQSAYYKNLGVIHYTNPSPNNAYGEGFYHNTPTLNIPTIMWHRSATSTMGLILSGDSIQKTLTNLNITYYNLVDSTGYVVGKIFDGLKIFVIEDQDLLYAMSFKSNRNWTLPQITVSIGSEIVCP